MIIRTLLERVRYNIPHTGNVSAIPAISCHSAITTLH